MEESDEGLRVVPELYFLIAKFLSGGPLKETAKTLLEELERVEVLPRRLDWEGNEHAQSYDELASQYEDMSWTRLATVCAKALQLARTHPLLLTTSATILPTTSGALLPSASGTLLPTASGTLAAITSQSTISPRLSLLSDSLVIPKHKYSVYKDDHCIARRIQNRSYGLHPSSLPGGRGGPALLTPRLLSSLQLQRRTLGHLSAVYCVVFDGTGRYVLTGADDLLIKVWSAIDGRLLCTLRGAGAEITDASVSPDGALLAAGSVERLVRVWCLRTAAPKAVLHAHAGTITSVQWSPVIGEVRSLASTSTDGSVAFWTCSRDGQFLSQPVQYVERMRPGACHMICAAWSAGGLFLAAGSADQHVRVYLAGDGAPRRVLEVAVHSDAVDSIAWAHRGLRFVSGSKDGTAAVWSLHATQWRHQVLRCLPLDAPTSGNATNTNDKRLKVTMVCWDRSDSYILTAVSDCSVRVWCSRRCVHLRALLGHTDEAYVLEPHPLLEGVVLSAAHDGRLIVWNAANGELLAKHHDTIAGQGEGAIFDAKWGTATTIAATDSHGHLLLLGIGRGHPLLADLPTELFFHTDYRPLVRDALGGALDEQTQTPPHLMPAPFLVDVEGAPHPPRHQRRVPGRAHLAPSQLVPSQPAPSRLDLMIEALAADRTPPADGHMDDGEARGVWRGEGVRHTSGQWQLEPTPTSGAPTVPPLDGAVLARLIQKSAEMHSYEWQWYRRELRRRPLMISTGAPHGAPAAGARGGAPTNRGRHRAVRRARPRPQPGPQPHPPVRHPSPPSSESSWCSERSEDRSVRSVRSARSARTERSLREPRRSSLDSDSSCSYTSDKTEESSASSYSDWELGAALAPPARARRRPQPAIRYSPPTSTSRRPAPTAPTPATDPTPTAGPASPTPGPSGQPESADISELYRPGEWLTAVTPRKAPYQPQMGDTLLYFRLGHQRYFEAVSEKDVYKVNQRDKPWERTHVNECELVKVVGIKYVIKPPRIACLRLSQIHNNECQNKRSKTFTVKYHDMPDVIDFLVLKQQYDVAVRRRWGEGDRFRCMIDDSWWTGVVLEKTAPPQNMNNITNGTTSSHTESTGGQWASEAAAHFLSLKVRWDNGEVERLSPWDLEPIDTDRLPSEPGGAVPVLAHELEAVLYTSEADEWPNGDRDDACQRVAEHISQVMSLSAAEPFVAPVDLQLYPTYARVVPYPVDLATLRARCQHLFYRRLAALQWDARHLATNAEQFNEPHSPIVRQARLVTDLLLYIISNWREVDVVAKYHELAAAYHSSDDEPLANNIAHKSSRSRSRRQPTVDWRQSCSELLRELLRSADSEPFRQPVSLDQAPDYMTVVARPLDLGTVGERLQAGRYSRAEKFAADVRRVFSNSRLYNTNKRSRIYSMTVRLSALFESLWRRLGPRSQSQAHVERGEGHSRAHRPRRAAQRSRRVLRQVYEAEGQPAASSSDSSDSEPLAAASRRRHDTSGNTHERDKGKGVGKKSKSSSASAEPVAGPSRVPDPLTPNGVTSSEDETLSHMRSAPNDEYITVNARDLGMGDYEPNKEQNSRKRRRQSSSDSSEQPRRRAPHTRTRERITDGSSSSSSSSSSGSVSESARRYESDRSYHPRYSSDDDAPLHTYRQRRTEEEEPGPSTSSRRSHQHRNTRGGVSLRARVSLRRYNEDSEEDSIAAISKRVPHHHRRPHSLRTLDHRRRLHATQSATVSSRAPPPNTPPHRNTPPDHDYYDHNGTAPNGEASTGVSISSRGRVRKLTAKARGLLHD